ncbi:hypothetical protein AMATHDRAFT_67672 [Amanita thiersii Skay4041]|uniref:Uncharacterized protein n=1 Tax=Amanita thiersii Skay4041 TaxID=703135 RepID=A0A2A9NBS1_9AGAR|nr:hypothetical protein AMATHDRAFT_67672 [Amanita thiersii Skay4041]
MWITVTGKDSTVTVPADMDTILLSMESDCRGKSLNCSRNDAKMPTYDKHITVDVLNARGNVLSTGPKGGPRGGANRPIKRAY